MIDRTNGTHGFVRKRAREFRALEPSHSKTTRALELLHSSTRVLELEKYSHTTRMTSANHSREFFHSRIRSMRPVLYINWGLHSRSLHGLTPPVSLLFRPPTDPHILTLSNLHTASPGTSWHWNCPPLLCQPCLIPLVSPPPSVWRRGKEPSTPSLTGPLLPSSCVGSHRVSGLV